MSGRVDGRGWRARALGVALGLAVLGAGCGNQVVVTAGDVASNYVYAVAEGNNAKACGYFAPESRAQLVASARPPESCAAILERCVPRRYRHSSGDQSQLLYANTDVVIRGDRATVTLSATPAASAVRRVTLIHRRESWLLTSPGQVITHCLRARRADRHG